ncbi:MAG: DUF1707 domain-containing protein [Nocardioides sp.]
MTGPVAGQLRLGDAERQRAAESLAEHFAAGRLDGAEHSERLDRVWAAKTYADLHGLFDDLPGGSPVASPGFGWSPTHVTPAARAAAFPPAPRRTGVQRPVRLALILLAVFAVIGVVSEHGWIIVLAVALWVGHTLFGRRSRRRSGRTVPPW